MTKNQSRLLRRKFIVAHIWSGHMVRQSATEGSCAQAKLLTWKLQGSKGLEEARDKIYPQGHVRSD